MITYELAIKLRDHGFPQHFSTEDGDFKDEDEVPFTNPSLSELIEACDNLCHDLAIFSDGDGWRCGDYMPYEHDWVVRIENKDLDTAMALLWLELNKK